MVDSFQINQRKESNLTPKPSHNNDSPLIAIARLLARQAANADYQAEQAEASFSKIKDE